MNAGCAKLPVIGWIAQIAISASVSVPFWFFWSYGNLGALYFYWLPEVYQSIPFWDCVGLAVVISILKLVLVPKLVEANAEATSSKDHSGPTWNK